MFLLKQKKKRKEKKGEKKKEHKKGGAKGKKGLSAKLRGVARSSVKQHERGGKHSPTQGSKKKRRPIDEKRGKKGEGKRMGPRPGERKSPKKKKKERIPVRRSLVPRHRTYRGKGGEKKKKQESYSALNLEEPTTPWRKEDVRGGKKKKARFINQRFKGSPFSPPSFMARKNSEEKDRRTREGLIGKKYKKKTILGKKIPYGLVSWGKKKQLSKRKKTVTPSATNIVCLQKDQAEFWDERPGKMAERKGIKKNRLRVGMGKKGRGENFVLSGQEGRGGGQGSKSVEHTRKGKVNRMGGKKKKEGKQKKVRRTTAGKPKLLQKKT